MTRAWPPPLVPGDVVAVIAPSSSFPRNELWRALGWIRARYRIHMQPGIFSQDGYLAGDDARRRGELARAMLDDDVKAILAARGGYGSIRIMDELPWGAFSRRPKWIVGFSDVTALHVMACRANVASVHGPNVTELGRSASASSRLSWLDSLERPLAARSWRGLRVVHPGGEAMGPVVGGNLAILHAMAAAGRLDIPMGSILALEDVGEAPYRVDRMLTSLRLGGYLSRVAALLVGGFERCPPGADGRSIGDVLEACTRHLSVPVLSGAPFGHGTRNEAFVLGATARVRGDTVAWISADSVVQHRGHAI